MDFKITVTCCFCTEKHETVIDLPPEWSSRYGEIVAENGFCPKHSLVAEFASDQCPGCVGGWMDCNLWSSFAYSKNELTEKDFEVISRGVCPKRTNGTFTFSRGTGFQAVALSRVAPSLSGEALVAAIKEYCEKYHNGS